MSTFKNFESDDVVNGRIQSVSTGLFSGDPYYNQVFYTSSVQIQTEGASSFDVKSGLYQYELYSDDFEDTSANPEYLFSVTYGHYAGSGSSDNDRDNLKIFPTQAVYTQYRNLLLNPDDELFTFQSGSGDPVDSPDVYVISFAGSKYKERLDPGNFEFSLSGSNGVFTFVDDSLAQSVTGTSAKNSSYNIVSGSLESNDASMTVN